VRRIDPRREDGVAMVEFALVVPLFLALFIGMVGLGRAFFLWNDANHVANETARWAAIDHNPYSVTLQQHASDTLGGANVCIAFQDDTPLDGNPNNGTPSVGSYVTVKVQKPLRLSIHLPKFGGLDTGFTIRGTSTMRVEDLENLGSPASYSTGQNLGTCQ
jgi:hypothetical protein